MRLWASIAAAAFLLTAGSAQAVVKAYNQSRDNGLAGDFLNSATNLCPPLQTTPGLLQGFTLLDDQGPGANTISLDLNVFLSTFIDLGPDQLTLTFGPGAFIFIDSNSSRTNRGQVDDGMGGTVTAEHSNTGPDRTSA